MALDGGQPITICRVLDALYGAAWTEDDDVLFATSGGLFRVPAAGGEPEQIRAPGSDFSLRSLEPVPGGEWILASFRAGFRGGWDVYGDEPMRRALWMAA